MSLLRIGGAYGSRISRCHQIAVACSLVTHLMNRPCRFVMSIQANMRIIGKRSPSTSDFEVSIIIFINYLMATIYHYISITPVFLELE